jgi:hypothetical protein
MTPEAADEDRDQPSYVLCAILRQLRLQQVFPCKPNKAVIWALGWAGMRRLIW